MDWQTLRRQRLAKASSSHEKVKRKGSLANFGMRASGVWRSFGASAFWEKSVIIVGVGVLAVTIPIAYFVFAAGSGDAGDQPPQSVIGPTATEAQVYVIDQPTSDNPATATPEPTEQPPTPTATTKPTDEAAPPANRRDCDAISGTAYQSPAERDWYLANCTSPSSDPVPPGGSVSGPAPTATNTPPPIVGPVFPTATPTPTPNFPSDAALIYHAVNWLTQDAPGYEVAPGTCTASPLAGSQWLVSCLIRPAGCAGVACFDVTTVSMCVTSPTFTVWRC